MKSILSSLSAAAIALVTSFASAQVAPFSDSLVQPPELAAPSRGSIAGQYASFSIGPGDVSRGAYSLPLPITLPAERGELGASFVPSYSPDAALSEWGAGWSAPYLSIFRSRVSGDIDYASDERTGPWGRMVKGSDGAWYPVGLRSLVRVEEVAVPSTNPCGPGGPIPIGPLEAISGGSRAPMSAARIRFPICPDVIGSFSSATNLIAYLPDGSVWTFTSSSGVDTPAGTYSWQLESVVTVLGRKTSYAYAKNTSGRPFLATVRWGGTDPATPQYEATFDYETVTFGVPDYRSGQAVLLDQRLKTVHALVLEGGALVERYRYDLTFQQDGGSPTFYLGSIQQTFAGGAQAPAVTYSYELSRDYFAQATGQRIPKLDTILQQYGTDVFLANKSTSLDVDLDGRPDLELQFDNRILRQTDSGFVVDTLPAVNSDANPLCRRAPSPSNTPRILARMRAGIDDSNVVALLDDANHANTGIAICDRTGMTQWQSSVAGDWALGPNTRLVDLNRDHQPDLVRVYAGGYQAMPNTSTSTTFGFGPPVTSALSPSVQADTTWIHDINGDGIPDIVSRFASGVVAWMGEGHLQFDPQGKTFPILSATGQSIANLRSYQFVFFDANNDGITDLLLSNGGSMLLFANSGNAFISVPVPYFQTSAWASVRPAVLDVAGNGNTEIAFVQGGLAYGVDLDAPGVGLLTSADDGRGTILRFGYGRAAPEVGVRYRNSLLGQVQVTSTGYDVATYQYAYGKPDLHSVGQFLLGYENVTRTGALESSKMTFSNSDAAAGVLLTSIERDTLAPSVEGVSFRQYDDASVRGVPWKRLKSEGKGFQSTDPANPQAKLVQNAYLAYANDVCPSQIQETTSAGVLLIQKTFDALPAFEKSLACVDEHTTITGSHSDSSLNFRHEAEMTRNAVGLLTRLALLDHTGTELDVQDVSYSAAWQVSSITVPGHGTSSFTWAPGTGLLQSATGADGVISSAVARAPLTDALTALTIDRGQGTVLARNFAFDGLERLWKSWNNLGHASASVPNETLLYRYASGAMPALTQVGTLFDPASGGYTRSAELATAAGEVLAKVRLIPEGWAFEGLSQRSRATRSVNAFAKATANVDITTLDVPSLYASSQALGSTQTSLFGFASTKSQKLSAAVERDITTTLGLTGAFVETTIENGALATSTTLDEKQRVVRRQDPAGGQLGYTYDAYGRVRRVTLPDGAVHGIDFDDLARPSRITRDRVASITYAYDAATGLLTERDLLAPAGTATAGAAWRRVQYTYDAIGRVAFETDIDARTGETQTFQSFYDGATPAAPAVRNALGLITAVVGDRYVKTLSYRADGSESRRVVTIDGWRRIQTDTTYDEDGQPHQRSRTISDGAGAVLTTDKQTFLRDPFGRVNGEQRDGSPFATFAYDVRGLPLWATYANGNTVTLTHDPLTRVRVGINENVGSWSSAASVTMNNRALVGAEDISVAKQSYHRAFTYSPQGFLTQSSDAETSYAYGYALDGSPTSVATTQGGTTETRTFVKSGELLTAGAHHHRFDDVGRVIERDAVSMTYGPNGQIASAHSGATSWTYLYDETGNRLAKLGSNGAPVAAYLEDGSYLDATTLTEPVRFAGQTIGVLRGPASAGAHAAKELHLAAVDLAGTVLSDEDGTPRFASPFGDRATHPNLMAAIDYATKGFDADLGAVRMGVRDYDASLSRFLQPDPLFLESPAKCLDSPIDCALYVYAHDAPTTLVDPGGRTPAAIAIPWAVGGGTAVGGEAAAGGGLVIGGDIALGPVAWAVGIVGLAVYATTHQDEAKAEPRVRFCEDTVAKQEGHHTIPRALMSIMTEQHMMNAATLAMLWPTDNRDSLLRVDRATHQQIHEGLTEHLQSLHPDLALVKGFPSAAWWGGYVADVMAKAPTLAAAKSQIITELSSYYMSVRPIESSDSCGHEEWQVPIFKFAQDALTIMASPAEETSPVSSSAK